MATSASNAKTNKRNMHNDANKSDAGSKTNNQHDDAASGTDAASQELFEKMFMSSEPKQRTVMGGGVLSSPLMPSYTYPGPHSHYI